MTTRHPEYEREFRAMVRPVVEDAAESIQYASGFSVEKILRWFDAASVEVIQYRIMGAVQDGIKAALDIDDEVDYSDPIPPPDPSIVPEYGPEWD